MKNVLRKLKHFSQEIKLADRFNYNFNIDSIFTKTEKTILNSEKNPFLRNKELKEILKKKYHVDHNNSELDFWIINKWGGIRGFKNTSRNIEKIKNFKKQIIKKKLSKDSFSTISSLSKVSSFMDPDNFFIYDSRVIYTLNWLILTCENKSKIREKYFPLPNGRNKIISNFDMNTIINIAHISEYENQESLYLKEQEAYFKYCEFIQDSYQKVFDNQTAPYELEMLLFTIADKEIFKDIKKNINISIKKKSR